MSVETMSKEYNINLSIFMSGMKRTVASQNADGEEIFDSGKKSMSYDVYKKLCEFLFEEESDEYSRIYHLEWKLLSRRYNFLAMNITNVQWKNDSLVFYFAIQFSLLQNKKKSPKIYSRIILM